VVEVESVLFGSDGMRENAKEKLWTQLMKSVDMLGDHGGRWHSYLLGVAIIGREVAFIEKAGDTTLIHKDGEGKLEWFFLFDEKWTELMNKFADKFEPE
jgi:hypothetical protein